MLVAQGYMGERITKEVPTNQVITEIHMLVHTVKATQDTENRNHTITPKVMCLFFCLRTPVLSEILESSVTDLDMLLDWDMDQQSDLDIALDWDLDLH
jgi:hypothetical protein